MKPSINIHKVVSELQKINSNDSISIKTRIKIADLHSELLDAYHKMMAIENELPSNITFKETK